MGKNGKILFLFSLLFLFSCGKRGEKVGRGEFIPTVAVTVVEKRKVTRTLQLFGTISGEEQVMVFSKITGRVTEIRKREGSEVKEGEAIVYVLNDIPGMDYKPGPVPSPISGVVGKIYVEVGQQVGPTTPIANVANYSQRVKIKAPLSDQDLKFVKKSAPARISLSAYPDTAFEGWVSNVSPILDPISRTATVEITIPNKNKKLIPGMAAKIVLVLEEKENALALPRNAIFFEEKNKVFVVEDEVAHLKEVAVGLIGDELVEITSGLREGEKVVTLGKERLKDGGKVRVAAHWGEGGTR
ncbi:MAG: efflux RND transporter periplasmic adaptor subunit [candidate division WOR-3 bacterium]